jgi:hypothetical protein
VGEPYRALVQQLYSVLAPSSGEAALEVLQMVLHGQLGAQQLVDECTKLPAQGAAAPS